MTCQHQITKSSTMEVNFETITGTLSLFKIVPLNRFSPIRAKQRLHKRRKKILRKFLEPSQKSKVVFADNSLMFGKSCEDLSWNHRTSTPHRSETNGTAESAGRQVAKCPRLFGRWEKSLCKTVWRAIHPKGQYFILEQLVEYHPISTRDQSRLHQFGNEVLPGILIAGGIWKGDILVADLEDVEKLDASEIHPRRINAKEVLTPPRGDEFLFPAADGTAKLLGRDYDFREPTPRREQTVRSEDFS